MCIDAMNTGVLELCFLVKVEIGGLRGKVLTMGVHKIYQQFTEFYGIFGKRSGERLQENCIYQEVKF